MPIDVAQAASLGEEVKAKSRKYSKAEFLKLKEGLNRIRILPPFGDALVPFPAKEFVKVFSAGPGGKGIFTPAGQFGQPCVWEKYKEDLVRRGDDASLEELKKTQVRNRVAMIVVDRDNEAQGPVVFETNTENFSKILSIVSDPDYGDITDPVKGCDLKIDYTPGNKTKNGFPEWYITPARESSPLCTDASVAKKWMETDWFSEFGVGQPDSDEWVTAVLNGTEESLKRSSKETSGGTGINSLPTSSSAPSPAVEYQSYWFSDNGEVRQIPRDELFNIVSNGRNPQVIPVEAPEGTNWKVASDYGFVPKPKQDSPAPPAPRASGPPAPPAPPQEEKAPWEEEPATSEVADDLRRQLAGSR